MFEDIFQDSYDKGWSKFYCNPDASAWAADAPPRKFRRKPTPLPTGEDQLVASRRLTAAEQAASLQGVYYASVRHREAKDAARMEEVARLNAKAQATPLSKAREHRLLDHLHGRVELKKVDLAQRSTKEKVRVDCAKMGKAELQASINRMYHERRQKKEVDEERLKEKYLRPKDRHVLSAAQEQACNDRLYLKGKDRFPQVRQQLWNKYLAPMETPSKVLPPTDVQVMVQRLYPKP